MTMSGIIINIEIVCLIANNFMDIVRYTFKMNHKHTVIISIDKLKQNLLIYNWLLLYSKINYNSRASETIKSLMRLFAYYRFPCGSVDHGY